MQSFFPLIEERRNFYIEKYNSQLAKAIKKLDIRGKNTGDRIDNPYDLEVGQILYCYSQREVQLANSNEGQELRFLRDARNALAHIEVLTSDMISRLLDISEL
ncbi:hypothetical protein FACS1894211_05100 [Clostridia bacterium]|nr:hypothetical protein FACS1894211_05100 [Clostridia bacterium]